MQLWQWSGQAYVLDPVGHPAHTVHYSHIREVLLNLTPRSPQKKKKCLHAKKGSEIENPRRSTSSTTGTMQCVKAR